jgi:hypothetical protein
MALSASRSGGKDEGVKWKEIAMSVTTQAPSRNTPPRAAGRRASSFERCGATWEHHRRRMDGAPSFGRQSRQFDSFTHAHGTDPPPRRRFVRRDGLGQARIAEELVTPDARQHRVGDRAAIAHDEQRPPERADIRLGRRRERQSYNPRYTPRSSFANHSFDRNAGNPANSTVFSSLSNRNSAWGQSLRTRRSRKDTTSVVGVAVAGPSATVSR